MKLTTRRLGAGAAAVVVAMTLAACAGAPSSGSGSGSSDTVTFRGWAPIDPALGQMVSAFEKDNPGKKVSTTVMGGPDYWVDLQTRAASNTMPDIVGLMPGAQTQQYRDKLYPLNQCAEDTWGKDWKDKFYDIGLQSAQLGNPDGDDNFYGLPVMNQMMLNWANTKIMDKQGLELPKTWSDLVSTTKTLSTSQSATPFLFGAKESWLTNSVFFQISNNVSPGTIYDAEDGKVSWTDPKMISSFEWYQKLFTNGIVQKGAVAYEPYPNGVDAFAAGKAVMMTNGSQWIQQSNPQADQGTIPALLKGMSGYEPFAMPTIPGGASEPQYVGGSEFLFGISKQSKNKALACKVITNWIAGSGAQKLVDTLFDLPVVKGMEPSKFSSAKQKQIFQTLNEDWLPKVKALRYFKNPKIDTAVGNALAGLGSGQLTPEQAAAAVQKVQDSIS